MRKVTFLFTLFLALGFLTSAQAIALKDGPTKKDKQSKWEEYAKARSALYKKYAKLRQEAFKTQDPSERRKKLLALSQQFRKELAALNKKYNIPKPPVANAKGGPQKKKCTKCPKKGAQKKKCQKTPQKQRCQKGPQKKKCTKCPKKGVQKKGCKKGPQKKKCTKCPKKSFSKKRAYFHKLRKYLLHAFRKGYLKGYKDGLHRRRPMFGFKGYHRLKKFHATKCPFKRIARIFCPVYWVKKFFRCLRHMFLRKFSPKRFHGPRFHKCPKKGFHFKRNRCPKFQKKCPHKRFHFYKKQCPKKGKKKCPFKGAKRRVL